MQSYQYTWLKQWLLESPGDSVRVCLVFSLSDSRIPGPPKGNTFQLKKRMVASRTIRWLYTQLAPCLSFTNCVSEWLVPSGKRATTRPACNISNVSLKRLALRSFEFPSTGMHPACLRIAAMGCITNIEAAVQLRNGKRRICGHISDSPGPSRLATKSSALQILIAYKWYFLPFGDHAESSIG